jgi:hypothetical protein
MSLSRERAAKRFPVSARNNRIYGEGFFALVSRCNPRLWTVYLFQSPESRQEKISQWKLSQAGCRAVRGCNDELQIEDLRPVALKPRSSHTDQYNFFSIAVKPIYGKDVKS